MWDGKRGDYDDKKSELSSNADASCLRKVCAENVVPCARRAHTICISVPPVDETRIRLGAGEFLFRACDPQVDIHAVKAGALKSCVPPTDGRHNIVAFDAMGNALDVDALGRGEYLPTPLRSIASANRNRAKTARKCGVLTGSKRLAAEVQTMIWGAFFVAHVVSAPISFPFLTWLTRPCSFS